MELKNSPPYLRITDHDVFRRFCERCRINPSGEKQMLITQLAECFSHIPYENLTKIVNADDVISADSAMRYPDILLRDWLAWGTGGTCFSLTAAIIAVFNALGIESYPILADRHYGPDTHCGLVIADSGRFVLLDPGYLLFEPTILPRERPTTIDLGYNIVELNPQNGGQKVELYTIVKNSRKLRLTYKVAPVDDIGFGRAWKRSFAWEMMTYPVLTRRFGNEHYYFQKDMLYVRGPNGSERKILTQEMQIEFMTKKLGVSKDVVSKALGAVLHGRNKGTFSS